MPSPRWSTLRRGIQVWRSVVCLRRRKGVIWRLGCDEESFIPKYSLLIGFPFTSPPSPWQSLHRPSGVSLSLSLPRHPSCRQTMIMVTLTTRTLKWSFILCAHHQSSYHHTTFTGIFHRITILITKLFNFNGNLKAKRKMVCVIKSAISWYFIVVFFRLWAESPPYCLSVTLAYHDDGPI